MSAFGAVGVPRSVPAFNEHARNSNHADDAEYERLRGIAEHEANLRGQCFEASKRAYEQGNGQLAHEKSEEGKVRISPDALIPRHASADAGLAPWHQHGKGE